jgi:hypothetical protein
MGLHISDLVSDMRRMVGQPSFDDEWLKFRLEAIHLSPKFLIEDTSILRDEEIINYSNILAEAALLRLPYRSCYFEFHDPSGTISCIVQHDDDYVYCESYVCPKSTRLWYFPYPGGFAGWDIRGPASSGDTNWFVLPDSLGKMDEEMMAAQLRHAEIVGLAIALMDLKESRVEEVVIPEGIKRHRAKKKRPPLYDHKILTITPEARRIIAERNKKVGDNPSLIKRRAHWRRGHLRHLPDKIISVRPALVRGEGFVSKDYKLLG